MSEIFEPFNADRPLAMKCSCGRNHSVGDHVSAFGRLPDDAPGTSLNARNVSEEEVSTGFVEAALVKALFPQEPLRRAFLKAVGGRTAAAAIASLLPVGAMQAMAQDKRPLEKTELKIGFLPITCATPLVAADPLGFYAKEGLKVTLNRTAGWAVIRDKTLASEFDAAHMLSPMPLAITMGLGAQPTPMVMPAIENVNGNAITLHIKHKDNRDPKKWKGMKFGIPFDYSMHNFLLRYYLAENGIGPDTDVQLRVMAPPDMVANLRAENIDGFIVAEPFNQRAVFDGVGFIHKLTSECTHPCCVHRPSRLWTRTLIIAALFIVTSTMTAPT